MLIHKTAAPLLPAPVPVPVPAVPVPVPVPVQDSFISVGMLPQDPLISQIEAVKFPAVQFGTQLSGPRLNTQDSIPVAQADSQGNYIFDISSPQFDQVNTHGVVAGTLLTYEHYMGHTTPWSFKGPLAVNPHAGEGKTAYYSRWDQSINFCQWDSPSAGKIVKTSQAFDVGSHETGHAILDGIRPGIMGGSEGSAFHEGFGDSSAILHALQYDSNLEKILAENQGDFSKPSLVSRLAEEFGTAFNKEDDNPNNDDHPYYRTALNEFKYVNPKELPSDTYPPHQPEEVLTSEAHSFSRVWSGSFYSMLGSLFQKCSESAPTQLEALKSARDVLGAIWGRSLDHLPAANLKFRNAAMGMLREANTYQEGRYFDTLATVMLDRNLLTPEQVEQAHKSTPTVRLASPVQTRDEAQALVGQLELPGSGWLADAPQAGADGRQVLTFRDPQRVSVDLGARGAAQLEISAGLTLVFDKQGQLQAQTYTPVTAEDVQDAGAEARRLADSGRLAVGENSSPLAQLALIAQPQGLPLLQHIPVWD